MADLCGNCPTTMNAIDSIAGVERFTP